MVDARAYRVQISAADGGIAITSLGIETVRTYDGAVSTLVVFPETGGFFVREIANTEVFSRAGYPIELLVNGQPRVIAEVEGFQQSKSFGTTISQSGGSSISARGVVGSSVKSFEDVLTVIDTRPVGTSRCFFYTEEITVPETSPFFQKHFESAYGAGLDIGWLSLSGFLTPTPHFTVDDLPFSFVQVGGSSQLETAPVVPYGVFGRGHQFDKAYPNASLVVYWPQATPERAGFCLISVSGSFREFRDALQAALAVKSSPNSYEAALQAVTQRVELMVNNFATWDLIGLLPQPGVYYVINK